MEKNEQVIALNDLWTVFKKNIVWILVAAVILGCLAALAGQLLITDVYTCSMTCVLGDVNMSSSEFTQLPKNAERSKLILQTTDVVAKVVKKAGIVDEKTGEPAVSAMKKATSIKVNSDVGAYTISVSTGNPEVSYMMIMAYNDLLPELVQEHKMSIATVVELSEKAPTSPSNSGRALKYGAIGFVIGAVAVFGIFFVKKLFDVTIYTTGDLESATDIPVIGVIPKYSGDGGTASGKNIN